MSDKFMALLKTAALSVGCMPLQSQLCCNKLFLSTFSPATTVLYIMPRAPREIPMFSPHETLKNLPSFFVFLFLLLVRKFLLCAEGGKELGQTWTNSYMAGKFIKPLIQQSLNSWVTSCPKATFFWKHQFDLIIH